MKLEQHVYTSGKTEFITVAVTQGINREERIKLENYSLYILPGSLLYKDEYPKPKKYIFYPLNDERFVVGKAVYIGHDKMGRPGNYLFHNFIISKEGMIELYLNPVRLIRWLEEKGLFTDKVPVESLQLIDVSVNETKSQEINFITVQKDHVLDLLYYCFNHESQQNPLLLTGTDKEYLDFLEWLYNILPFNLREKFSFDTYSYGTSLGIKIVGIPDTSDFQQSISYALKLNLTSQQYTLNFDLKGPNPIIKFIAEMVVAGKTDEINSMNFMGYCLEKGDYAEFKKRYQNLSNQIRDFIFISNREHIFNHIVNQRDTELLLMITDKITVEDLTVISSNTEIIHSLIATEDNRILEMFVEWFYTKADRKQFYPLMFEFHDLWFMLLERIRHNNDINLLLETFQVVPQHYSEQIEETLIEKILNMLHDIKGKKEVAKDFALAIDSLPETESEASYLIRKYIKYELTDDSALLNTIIMSDMSVLAEEYQARVLDSILRGIFKNSKPEERQQQLNKFLDKAQDKQACLIKLLEKIRSNNNMNLLLEVFQVIPQHYSEQIEETLLEKTFTMLPEVKGMKKLAKDFMRSIDNLPKTESKNINLLRNFIKYELTDAPVLLNKMIDIDISVLTEEHQVIVFNEILRGIIRTTKPEEIQHQIDRFFNNARDKEDCLLKLMYLLENEIPDKAIKYLKEPISELVKKLPEGKSTNEIKNRVEKLFESKPSFLSKLFGLRLSK